MDMSVGYDRAAFFEMLRVLAWEPILSFSMCEFSDDRKNWQRRTVVRYLETNRDLTEDERNHLANMKEVKRISESKELMSAIFDVGLAFSHFTYDRCSLI